MPGRATTIPELSQTYRKPGKFQKIPFFYQKFENFDLKRLF